MRKSTAAALLLVGLVAFAPNSVESQGIGGMIKKKAAEVVKGKDPKKAEGQTVAKDDGPIKSQFECELDGSRVDRFLKGMEAELGQRAEFERSRSGAKSDNDVAACRSNEVSGSGVQELMMRGMSKSATSAQLLKAMEKNMVDVEAHLVKKCGEPLSKYGQFNRDAARRIGAQHAGLTDECYDKLKEFALAFCRGLTAEQQKAAAEQGIKVPGTGAGVYVYSADEAKALAPRCSQLISQIEATGYTLP